MPVFKSYQRSRKFGSQQPEDIKPYELITELSRKSDEVNIKTRKHFGI